MYSPRSWAVVCGLGGGMTLLLSLMLEVAVIATQWRSGQPCAGSDGSIVFERRQESLHAARLIKRPECLKQDQGAIEASAGASEIAIAGLLADRQHLLEARARLQSLPLA